MPLCVKKLAEVIHRKMRRAGIVRLLQRAAPLPSSDLVTIDAVSEGWSAAVGRIADTAG